jgi:nitronate monooxygenase
MARRGIVTMVTVTSVADAVQALEAKVDVVVAQGFEAGGHRGTFPLPAHARPSDADADAAPRSTAPADACLRLHTLVRAIYRERPDALIVAAGGISTAEDARAVMALGAAGVQVGTLLLQSAESRAPLPQRLAMAQWGGRRPTVMTRAFSGRYARGLANVVSSADDAAVVLPFPLQHHRTVPLRSAAATLHADVVPDGAAPGAAARVALVGAEFMALWCGAGVGDAAVRASAGRGTEDILVQLAADCDAMMRRTIVTADPAKL